MNFNLYGKSIQNALGTLVHLAIQPLLHILKYIGTVIIYFYVDIYFLFLFPLTYWSYIAS